ncbi:MAG: very short patch repair endonuclease [Terriglobales bacterium]
MTTAQRSRCMSRIRSTRTKPELALRRRLWSLGFRFRVRSKLAGKPDIIFTKRRVVVFIDGCFWHGCSEHGTRPKTNATYWHPKIEGNSARDCAVTKMLQSEGWSVLRFWEHDVEANLLSVVERVVAELLDRGNAPLRRLARPSAPPIERC